MSTKRDVTKTNKNPNREEKLLQRLLDILNNTAKKQQTKSGATGPSESHGSHGVSATESALLDQFSSSFQNVRVFSTHPLDTYFSRILEGLVKQRLSNKEWLTRAPPHNVLRVFACLRILVRDHAYQQSFFDLGAVKILSKRLQVTAEDYLEDSEGQFTVDILKEMTNICQKLPTNDEKREWLVACGVHKPLVMLLYSVDIIVLHCSLLALIGLSHSEKPKISIAELNCVEVLLRIVESYDVASKRLAANLLRVLCSDINTREQVKVYEGIRICLSLLDSDDVKLLWHLVWIIVQISQDADSSDEVRVLGGIPLLLSLVQKDRRFHTEASVMVMSNEGAAKVTSDVSVSTGEGEKIDDFREIVSLKSATCTALTELVLNDTNAQQVVQANGLYLLSSLILAKRRDGLQISSKEEINALKNLQKNAFRTLRFLFSMERNRQLFKILFPHDIFMTFIDVGHYVRNLDDYAPLVEKINNLTAEDISVISSNIEAANKRKTPTRTVGSYIILELLGSGAFGSVYKVCKQNGDGTCCAMKEISLTNPALGKTMKERNKSSGNIVQELKIMKEQLSHPHVVRYLKAFQQTDKLYVIMDYIEGATLTEHFNSLKEKKERFSEERIWNIFIQIVLGLRYLHKEKHIVHRDLTPNNVMLGSNDKVTITDLGLARQKLPDASELTSVVGTMLYWCPEILQHRPYGEKADVWAAGCLLYQMATLRPPFYSSNLLQLATKIAEAKYEAITDEAYSHKLRETVERCITSDPNERPDIVEVGAMISCLVMKYTDKLRISEISLQKKLERERKRTQKHSQEATRNMQNYHRLFWANQERSDKMTSSASSAGLYNMRSRGESEASDTMLEVIHHDNEDNQVVDDSGFGHSLPANPDSNSSSNEDALPGNTAQLDAPSARNGHDTQPNSGSRDVSPVLTPAPAGPSNQRGKSSRRQLVLDMATIQHRGNVLPSLLSPTDLGSPQLPNDPWKRRTQSSSSVELYRRQTGGQTKARPPSAAATLSISPRKVRQINDPILQILNQLHKILFITQLPPPLTASPNRRIVEKFKRGLFCRQTSSFNLKSEIKKVLEGSKDIIDLNFGFERSSSSLHSHDSQGAVVEGIVHGAGISYEQMQAIIEDVLMESGYYDMTHTKHRRAPLGPIGGANGK